MQVIHQELVNLERVADLCALGIPRESPATRDGTLWHVTSLLRAGHSIVKGKDQYADSVEEESGIMSMGRIWETVVDCYMYDLAGRLGGLYVPDVTYTEDDICGSLDGVLAHPAFSEAIVCESKLRFTLREDIPLDHLQQIRAYCHLAGTDLAYYISGHISTTPPFMRALLRILKFTPLSVSETWQGILNTKRYLEGLGISPEGEQNARR